MQRSAKKQTTIKLLNRKIKNKSEILLRQPENSRHFMYKTKISLSITKLWGLNYKNKMRKWESLQMSSNDIQASWCLLRVNLTKQKIRALNYTIKALSQVPYQLIKDSANNSLNNLLTLWICNKMVLCMLDKIKCRSQSLTLT